MKLVILDGEHLPEFKREMQKAFRVGAEEGMGCSDIEVLP